MVAIWGLKICTLGVLCHSSSPVPVCKMTNTYAEKMYFVQNTKRIYRKDKKRRVGTRWRRGQMMTSCWEAGDPFPCWALPLASPSLSYPFCEEMVWWPDCQCYSSLTPLFRGHTPGGDSAISIKVEGQCLSYRLLLLQTCPVFLQVSLKRRKRPISQKFLDDL